MTADHTEDQAQTPPDESTPSMSYSRMNSILTCGEQFRLQRKLKVPERQHWASIGGSAFHKAVEGILRQEVSASQSMQSETKKSGGNDE